MINIIEFVGCAVIFCVMVVMTALIVAVGLSLGG